MAPRKPTKKPAKLASKAAAKVALKAAPKALMAKTAVAKAATPMAQKMPHNAATCVCPCHSPIDPKKYGCWCNCHVLALLCQKGTLAAWLLATTLLSVSNVLWGVAMTGGYEFYSAELVVNLLMGLNFALLFRLAYTGCGRLVEALKLGVLVMGPAAITFGTVVYMGGETLQTTALLATMVLAQGGLLGVFCGWLLKPAGSMSCCK